MDVRRRHRLAVDNDDLILGPARPNDLNDTENFAALNPPQASCCVKPPAVLAFDREGNLVPSWDSSGAHDPRRLEGSGLGGSNTFRVYTKPGKLVAEMRDRRRRPGVRASPPHRRFRRYRDARGRCRGRVFRRPAREVYVIDNYLRDASWCSTWTPTSSSAAGARTASAERHRPMPRPKYAPRFR